MAKMRSITTQDLRRLVISRQHLDGGKRPFMLQIIRDIGCLQLDPISAVQRSHLLVLWSRLGQYDVAALDKLLWEEKVLFEYWAHAASIVLTEEYPIHYWKMQQMANREGGNGRFQKWFFQDPKRHTEIESYVLSQLEQRGALFSREIDDKWVDQHQEISGWYSGRVVPRMLDFLWTRGKVTVVGRKGKQRQWGIAKAWFPDSIDTNLWTDEQISRFAAQKAIRALGAATPAQIRKHYTRGRYPQLIPMLNQLATENVIEKIIVLKENEPLKGDYYLHTDDLPLLAQIQSNQWSPTTKLLSPFDNLICDRDRTELLFDFCFRIEIYVPKVKRQFGYYVLPILHGDQLIGRIDPIMNRKSGTLHIHNVYAEPNAPDDDQTVHAMGQQITDLAQFLNAKQIEWGDMPSSWRKMK